MGNAMKIHIDKDDKILGWSERDSVTFEGSNRVIEQDVKDMRIDFCKLEGDIVVPFSEAETKAKISQRKAEEIKEKKIGLQMRIDAMNKLGYDTTKEQSEMEKLK